MWPLVARGVVILRENLRTFKNQYLSKIHQPVIYINSTNRHKGKAATPKIEFILYFANLIVKKI